MGDIKKALLGAHQELRPAYYKKDGPKFIPAKASAFRFWTGWVLNTLGLTFVAVNTWKAITLTGSWQGLGWIVWAASAVFFALAILIERTESVLKCQIADSYSLISG